MTSEKSVLIDADLVVCPDMSRRGHKIAIHQLNILLSCSETPRQLCSVACLGGG